MIQNCQRFKIANLQESRQKKLWKYFWPFCSQQQYAKISVYILIFSIVIYHYILQQMNSKCWVDKASVTAISWNKTHGTVDAGGTKHITGSKTKRIKNVNGTAILNHCVRKETMKYLNWGKITAWKHLAADKQRNFLVFA